MYRNEEAHSVTVWKSWYLFSLSTLNIIVFSQIKINKSNSRIWKTLTQVYSVRCCCKRLVYISQNAKLTPHFLKRLKQRALTWKFRSIAHDVLVPIWELTIPSHLFKLSFHLRHTIPSGLHFSVDAAVRHHRFYELQQSMPSLTDLGHNIKIRRFLDR